MKNTIFVLSLIVNVMILPGMTVGYVTYRERYEKLQLELLKKDYAEWQLDLEHYPPISVFQLKENAK